MVEESSVFTLQYSRLHDKGNAVERKKMLPRRADRERPDRDSVFVGRIFKFGRHFAEIGIPVLDDPEISGEQVGMKLQTVRKGKVCIQHKIVCQMAVYPDTFQMFEQSLRQRAEQF